MNGLGAWEEGYAWGGSVEWAELGEQCWVGIARLSSAGQAVLGELFVRSVVDCGVGWLEAGWLVGERASPVSIHRGQLF